MNEFIRRKIQERNLEVLARNPKGFQFTNTFFPYTSGQIGPYYVQSASILANINDYMQAIHDIANLTSHTLRNSHFDFIAGGETRDWIFSLPVATLLRESPVMIYKDGKVLPEIDFGDKNLVLVSDLNNEGSSPRDYWHPTMIALGGRITHAIFYVDRLEDGVEVLSQLGITNDAVVPLNAHAWDHLSKKEVIAQDVYWSLRDREESKQSRHDWAVKMLRSDSGLAEYKKLVENPKSIDKAAKILGKGYPELEHEIVDRLKLERELRTRLWAKIGKEKGEIRIS